MLIYERHEGSQPEKPSMVDTTSSKTKVYLRKNIERVTRTDEMTGEEYGLWQYEEATVTHDEFEQIVGLGINALEESAANTNDALDVVLTEELPTQAENIQTLSDTVDDILTNVIPSLMEG